MQKTNKQDKFHLIFWLMSMRYKFLLKDVLEKISKSVTWQLAHTSLFYKDYHDALFTAIIWYKLVTRLNVIKIITGTCLGDSYHCGLKLFSL